MARRKLDFKLLAFDIETHGLGGDAVYVSWCDKDSHGGEIVNTRDSQTFTEFFIDHFLTDEYHEHIIVAHAGLRFDLLRLDWLRLLNEGFKARVFTGKNKNNIRGLNITRGSKSKKRTWFIRDSLTWFPGKLEEFAKLYASDHLKGESPDWGKTKFNVRNPKHIRYAIQDSVALYHSCKGFDDFARGYFGVSVMDCVTLSGLGYAALKRVARQQGYEDFIFTPSYFEKAVRSSYHGGFTSAFKVGTFRDLIYLDVNSAYADVMEKYPMPSGVPVISTSRGKHEISLCLASVQFNDAFPYLVSKPETKFCAGRYAGHLYGWYWDFELDLQERLGASVNRHIFISWPEIDDRQKHFIGLCKNLRKQDYNGPRGKFAKLMQNSVYGKHGAQKHDTSLIMNLDQPSPEAFPLLANNGDVIEGFWEIPNGGGDNYNSMVHWASYITARVRWQLMNYLLMIPQKDWIYCDTDSFIVPAKYKKVYKKYIGEEYGQLKLEGELSTFTVNAPKTYKGVTKEGKAKNAAKGMPRTVASTAWRDGAATFEGSISLYSVMRGKILNKELKRYTRQMERHLSGPTSIRCGSYIAGVWTPTPIYASFDLTRVYIDLPTNIRQKMERLHP